MLSTKTPVIFDTELIGPDAGPVVFLFRALNTASGKRVSLWGHVPGDMRKMQLLLNNPNFVWVSFNGLRFDAPIISAVLADRALVDVKRIANRIIADNTPAWMIYRDYALEAPDFDHIDLIEVAPGVMVSLKSYQARMGMKTIRDLPFDHDEVILDDVEKMLILDEYCGNDLDATATLFTKLDEAITLREHMGATYKLDLRSKSDAQMAEAIIARALKITRNGPVEVPAAVRYKAPAFIVPHTDQIAELIRKVERHHYLIDQRNGAVLLPDFLSNEVIQINDGTYQMGVGGLHSTHDKSVQFTSGPGVEVSDADVGSFYPNIAVNAGMIPRGLGQDFIVLYRSILNQRMAAKHRASELGVLLKTLAPGPEHDAVAKEFAYKTVEAGGLKTAINGAFGKLGSMFSKIYTPDLMLTITLTGQLYLLILIGDIEKFGVKVVSANTDGICFVGSPEASRKARDWIECYGFLTGFEFEFTDYKTIALKDVNNYIAVTTGGKVKAKGLYANSGLMKNPTNEVCTLAAQAYLATGQSVVSFINSHVTVENIADFTQSRTVNGGAVTYSGHTRVDDWVLTQPGQWRRPSWPAGKAPVRRKSRPPAVEVGVDPIKLGRVARWYYCDDKARALHYATSGNLVPKSEGGAPMMTLADEVPYDLDVLRYIDEANANLRLMGVTV